MEELHLFTDGGCIGNPGKGAWAYVLKYTGGEITDSAGEGSTTNNRMELSAVINGLKRILGDEALKGKPITVCTDSQYVKNGITQWIHNWEKNNWRTAGKDPVKNQDLWKELKALSDQARPRWTWVRGHAGHPENEQCDRLVRQTMDSLPG